MTRRVSMLNTNIEPKMAALRQLLALGEAKTTAMPSEKVPKGTSIRKYSVFESAFLYESYMIIDELKSAPKAHRWITHW